MTWAGRRRRRLPSARRTAVVGLKKLTISMLLRLDG
jgi:hypothetical protein